MQGNFLTIFERISKVLKEKGITKKDGTPNFAEGERLAKISGTTLSKVGQRDGALSDYNKEKFLRTFHVNPVWFDTGKGDIFVSNITEDDKPGDNKGNVKEPEEVYRTIVEGNTEYVLIPRDVLKEVQLVSKSQLAKDEKTMDRLLDQNESLIRLVEQQSAQPKLPAVKERK